MSQATLPSRLSETASGPQQITSRLHSLRRAVSLWLWVRGIAYILLLLAAIVVVDLFLDWFFRMDMVQRTGCLILATLLLAWFLYRFLIRPLSRSINDESLALRVERHHQDLGQSLICALQFSRMTGFEELGVSTSMVRATIEHGTAAAEGVDFRRVMNDSALRRNLMVALGLVAIFAGLFALPLTRPMMQTWLNRNVLLGNEQWPQKSYLVVHGAHDGRIVIPRGDDWIQVVTVKEGWEEMPTEVSLESGLIGVPFWRSSRTEKMTQVGYNASQEGEDVSEDAEAEDHHFKSTFTNVLDPFKFRVKSEHETTRWYTVELVERPSVETLTLMLAPPKYTGQAAQELPIGKGPYVAYEGSSLTISGTANKTLSSAVLTNGDFSVEMDCTENEFFGVVPVGKLIGGAYAIEVTDDEPSKLKSSRPTKFAIKLKKDRAPKIRAMYKGVSGIILARAVVPIECKIRDEFAVASARLDYERKAPADPSAPPADGGPAPPPKDVKSLPFDALSEQYGQNKIQYTYPFKIGPLNLEVNTQLTLRVKATDTNDISGPNTGESDELVLRIVTRAEFIADLAERESEQGQQFERLLKDQIAMFDDTKAILAAVGGKSTMPDKPRRLLARVLRRENVVSDRCERIADQLEKLVAEMRNNRLFEDEDAAKTAGKKDEGYGSKGQQLKTFVIDPLRVLASKPVPKATNALEAARRAASHPGSRDAALARAVDTQQEIVVKMREILKNITTAKGYSKIINKLYEILEMQRQVNRESQAEKEAELERLFRGEDVDAPKTTEPKKTEPKTEPKTTGNPAIETPSAKTTPPKNP